MSQMSAKADLAFGPARLVTPEPGAAPTTTDEKGWMCRDMHPSLWGSRWWQVIDDVLDTFCPDTSEKREELARFVRHTLRLLLPCSECRVEYTNYLARFPPSDETLSSQVALKQWFASVRANIASRAVASNAADAGATAAPPIVDANGRDARLRAIFERRNARLAANHTQRTAPQTAPQAAPQVAPQAAPQTAPQATPQAAPQATPQATPQSASQSAPKAGPQDTPQAAPSPAQPETAPKNAQPVRKCCGRR